MSWGERSCTRKKCTAGICTMENCNVYCSEYEWDGVTTPDSGPDREPYEGISPREAASVLEMAESMRIKDGRHGRPGVTKAKDIPFSWRKKKRKKK